MSTGIRNSWKSKRKFELIYIWINEDTYKQLNVMKTSAEIKCQWRNVVRLFSEHHEYFRRSFPGDLAEITRQKSYVRNNSSHIKLRRSRTDIGGNKSDLLRENQRDTYSNSTFKMLIDVLLNEVQYMSNLRSNAMYLIR